MAVHGPCCVWPAKWPRQEGGVVSSCTHTVADFCGCSQLWPRGVAWERPRLAAKWTELQGSPSAYWVDGALGQLLVVLLGFLTLKCGWMRLQLYVLVRFLWKFNKDTQLPLQNTALKLLDIICCNWDMLACSRQKHLAVSRFVCVFLDKGLINWSEQKGFKT